MHIQTQDFETISGIEIIMDRPAAVRKKARRCASDPASGCDAPAEMRKTRPSTLKRTSSKTRPPAPRASRLGLQRHGDLSGQMQEYRPPCRSARRAGVRQKGWRRAGEAKPAPHHGRAPDRAAAERCAPKRRVSGARGAMQRSPTYFKPSFCKDSTTVSPPAEAMRQEGGQNMFEPPPAQ